MLLFTVRQFFDGEVKHSEIEAGVYLIYEDNFPFYVKAVDDVWEYLNEEFTNESCWIYRVFLSEQRDNNHYDWEIVVFPLKEAKLLMGLEDTATLENIEMVYHDYYKLPSVPFSIEF